MLNAEINAGAVVAMARQGQVLPGWQVYRGQPSFHARQIVLAILIALIGCAGAAYLLTNPQIAIVPGYSSDTTTLDTGPFAAARAFDFVIIGLLLAGGIWYAIAHAVQISSAASRVLIVMPEGFVVSIKRPIAYSFAGMRSVSASSFQGAVTLSITDAARRGKQRVRLDGRFGNARQLAGQIIAARESYMRSRTAMRSPSIGPTG